jgi:hypothetical protein
MNEIGLCVKADTATLQRQGALLNFFRSDAGQSNVNGLADHMQTVLCHAGTSCA